MKWEIDVKLSTLEYLFPMLWLSMNWPPCCPYLAPDLCGKNRQLTGQPLLRSGLDRAKYILQIFKILINSKINLINCLVVEYFSEILLPCLKWPENKLLLDFLRSQAAVGWNLKHVRILACFNVLKCNVKQYFFY